jgi:hypothetical protein
LSNYSSESTKSNDLNQTTENGQHLSNLNEFFQSTSLNNSIESNECQIENQPKQFYFLKLKNSGTNACFSNSTIQMLFTCGKAFFTVVMDLKCKSDFCTNFRKYITCYEIKSKESTSSFPIRLVANKNNDDPQDSYVDGSEQCCFGFLLQLFQHSCEKLKNIFRINYTERNVCSNCKYVLNYEKNYSTFYMSITRSIENDEIDFHNLFNPIIHHIPCLKCGCTVQFKYNNYEANGNFVILRIANESGIHRFKTKIKNINLNESITIPNLKGNFKCKSLIVHELIGSFGKKKRGHYRCFSKIETASDNCEFRWLNISDETCTPMRDYPVDLENVALLMLEKQP